MARTISLQSDLGGRLRFQQLQGRESLGQPYRYVLSALCSGDPPDPSRLLGTPFGISLVHDNGSRHLHGIVAAVALLGQREVGDERFTAIEVTLVPRLWLLGQQHDSRIFSGQSVADIVRTLLSEIGCTDVRLQLGGHPVVRDYCVQYDEPSLDFIHRLLQQEGLYYYFEHAADRHTLVLADGLGAHATVAPFERLPWQAEREPPALGAPGMADWQQQHQLRPTHWQLDEFDPAKPRAVLLGEAQADRDDGAGTRSIYRGHGRQQSAEQGRQRAQVRVEAEQAARAQWHGRTRAWNLGAGHLFELEGCPQTGCNRQYLVVASELDVIEAAPGSVTASAGPSLQCRLQVLDSRVPYRSLADTRWPRIAGLQSAIVAGDNDEDIAVDAQGRVNVHFHWSRAARSHGRVSCPVRVATSWAGKGWGAQSLPRVGQEVLVAFLEGDPDRPLIVGSVFNADHVPPYTLPEQRTRSGIRSRSHPDGGADDYNEICFEDRKGAEELRLHAQRDLHVEAEHDRTLKVGHDQQATIGNDQTLTVEHDQRATIRHDRSIKVDNEDSLDVGTHARIHVGQRFRLEAGQEIELVTGASRIVMNSAGDIAVEGVNVRIGGNSTVEIEGGVEVRIKAGASMDIGAGASLKMHSDATLQVQGGAMAEVKAPMLTLSGDALAKLAAALVTIG